MQIKPKLFVCISQFNDSGNIWFYLKDEKLRLKRNRLQERLQYFHATIRLLSATEINILIYFL